MKILKKISELLKKRGLWVSQFEQNLAVKSWADNLSLKFQIHEIHTFLTIVFTFGLSLGSGTTKQVFNVKFFKYKSFRILLFNSLQKLKIKFIIMKTTKSQLEEKSETYSWLSISKIWIIWQFFAYEQF